jgi:hypothetical protein
LIAASIAGDDIAIVASLAALDASVTTDDDLHADLAFDGADKVAVKNAGGVATIVLVQVSVVTLFGAAL